MTHLYIELNTGLTEEVDDKTIEKLYKTVTENTLDNTSDLKGRLHTPSARDIHVSYLTTHFPELYISADVQYITLADPDLESLLADYIGNGETIVLGDIQLFILSGKKFGERYYNPNRGGEMPWILYDSGYKSVNTFDEFGALFNGLTKIGLNAFCCPNLTSITIPSTVTEIGISAFYNTSALTSLNLNFENILSIGASAFGNSNIGGDISLPNLTYIGGTAFLSTKITSISLPAGIEFSGDGTFSGCSNLTQVTGLSAITNCRSSSFNNCSNLETIDIDFSIVTSIGNNAFGNCQKLNLGNLVLSGLTYLGSWAFQNCKKLYSIDLSNNPSITKLNSGIFSGCSNLTTAILPISCTTFDGREMFYNCSNLTSINTGNITEFGSVTFSNCTSLLSVDFSSATHVGDRCFSQSGITGQISIPNYSGTLDSYAFYGTTITSISLSSGCTRINLNAFENCTNLLTISNIGGVQTIERAAFKGCSKLTSVDLSNVTVLGYLAFEGCTLLSSLNKTTFSGTTYLHAGVFKNCSSLTGELSFPDLTELIFENGTRGSQFQGCTNLTKISLGHLAVLNHGYTTSSDAPFKNCTNLKIVDLGDSLTTLGGFNFEKCSNLKAIKLNITTPPSRSESFANITDIVVFFGNSNVNIYVPDSAVSTYLATAPFSSFADHIKPLSTYNEASILAS